MAKLKNLESTTVDNQIIINANGSKFNLLPFFINASILSNERERNKFIKAIENTIRTSAVYRAYIKYLKDDIGLKKCMLFGLLDDEKCKIEMHHGPIFTLYDYVEITLIYFLKNKKSISTFSVAKEVLQDHTDNLIQVVMLSEMAHQAAHLQHKDTSAEFIDITSAWGDLNGYLIKYKDCLTAKHYSKINKYIDNFESQKGKKSEVFINKLRSWNTEFKVNNTKEKLIC